jgi:hypothetical protein
MGVADIIGVAAIAITTVDAAIIERAHSALACGFAFGCRGTTALALAGWPVGDSAKAIPWARCAPEMPLALTLWLRNTTAGSGG